MNKLTSNISDAKFALKNRLNVDSAQDRYSTHNATHNKGTSWTDYSCCGGSYGNTTWRQEVK